MKWLIIAALLLTLIFGLPFREYDTAKLLPMETLQADTRDGKVLLVSEAGSGEGETFLAAVEDLRQKAPGDVFFDTAEHLVLCDSSLLPQILEAELLRPAAQVYFAQELQAPEALSSYLSAHPSSLTIAKLRAEKAENRKGEIKA